MLIGARRVFGKNGLMQAVDPATGEAIEPVFGGGDGEDIARACALAKAAFPIYRETSLEDRAKFLETIAWNIMEIGESLIARVMQESGLPRARLEGERGRTVGQLRLFAQVVREGSWIEARIDAALPGRQPAPRPDLRLRRLAVGPVAVFGASNFPLAFSVAGGDTASALAAGCPVLVKAHGAHPGTSLLVGEAIQAAVRQCGLPEGVFSLLFGADDAFSIGLVTDPRIKAVGFTGSRSGGTALMASAASRPEPIPVYAEMSSINPVILFPGALAERSGDIARAFASALALGAGQFCTNPGLVLVLDGPNVGTFIEAACAAICDTAAATMLTPGIHAAYEKGVAALEGNPVVGKLAAGQRRVGPHEASARLFETSGQEFLADDLLQGEVFGPSSLLVRCSDLAELEAVIDAIEGQLTVALHLGEGDATLARPLMPLLETKAGRLLVNGFGTGVEVGHAMVHGGPYPATSDGRSTSVGSLAIERFLRPVCYQDMPGELLPQALIEDNPLGIRRRIDGILQDIATME